MLVLGIDTTTLVGSIGLIEEKSTLAEYTLNIKRTHSERLLPALSSLLKDAGVTIQDVDLISVSQGPGSFTGVRIGVTTANSLAQGAQKPLVGVCSLDVLAHNLVNVQGLVCPILDARKQEVYTALYRGAGQGQLTKLLDYQAMSLEPLVEQIQERAEDIYFLGDGVKVYGDFLQKCLGERYKTIASNLLLPRGSTVAQLGLEKWQKGEGGAGLVEPLYLRKSEAELAWKKNRSAKMEELIIKKMTLEDIEGIWEIESLSFSVPWSKEALIEEVYNEKAFYLVAKLVNQVIGYAGCWMIVDEAHITNVAVHPAYRQKKVATLLLMALEQKLAEKGIDSLTLEVRASNQAAQNLYAQRGFRPLGLRKKYYTDNDEDALIMWKMNLRAASQD